MPHRPRCLLICHPDRSGGIARRLRRAGVDPSHKTFVPLEHCAGSGVLPCAPKTGRDPSTPLGMTETDMASDITETSDTEHERAALKLALMRRTPHRSLAAHQDALG